MTLGQRIVKLRKQKNFSQGDLAKELDMTQRQLLRWEKDEVRPKPTAIEALAQLFGVSVEELTVGSTVADTNRIQDPELQELLSYVPELESSSLDTLKNLLRDMIACQQMSRFTRRIAS